VRSKWSAAVVILAIVLHLPILKNGLVWDDHIHLRQNLAIRNISNIPTFFSTHLFSREGSEPETEGLRYWRPIMLTFLALTYRLFGLNPMGYHLLSIILHSMCTLLVFLFGKKVTGEDLVAAAGAAIFAIHPVHVEAVAFASSIYDLLLAGSALAALCCYHSFRKRSSSGWGLATLGFLILALLSKESGIMVPLVIAAYEVLLAPRKGRRYAWVIQVSSILLVGVYLALRHLIMGAPKLSLFVIPPASLPAFLTVIAGHYCRLLILPIRLLAFYSLHPIPRSLLEPEVLRSLFFILIFVLFLAMTLRDRKGLFWFFWIGLNLIPNIGIIGSGQYILGERYLYLSSVGFCFLLAELFAVRLYRPWPSKWSVVLMALLLSSFALRDLGRFSDWRDEFTFIRVTLRDNPKAYLLQNRLAYCLVEEPGSLDGVEKAYKTAVNKDSSFLEKNHNRAISLLENGELDKSLNQALLTANLQPESVTPLITAAEAAGRLGGGRISMAKALLRKALSIDPYNSMAYNSFGNLAFRKGKVWEALKSWKISEQLDPSNKQVLLNLSRGYKRLGDDKKADFYFNRYHEMVPRQGQN
jgi:tetratricopeptide (TPR) repeat protein